MPGSLQLVSGSRGLNCASPPLSPDEAAAAAMGDRNIFWRSRAARGDPLGATALSIVNNADFGQFANFRLRDAISSRSPTMSAAAISNEVNRIGVELMREHANLLINGNSPSSKDIAKYHGKVFTQHGLPRSTFGAAMMSGTPIEAEVTSPWWFHCR